MRGAMYCGQGTSLKGPNGMVAVMGDKDRSFYRPLKNLVDFSDPATISLHHCSIYKVAELLGITVFLLYYIRDFDLMNFSDYLYLNVCLHLYYIGTCGLLFSSHNYHMRGL